MRTVLHLPAAAELFSLFLVIASVACGAQEAKQVPESNHDDGYKVAGTVVNAISGAPLARATVSLSETQDRARMNSVASDGFGHFEFSGLGEGKYSLQGERGGFLTSAYEQHEQYSTAIVTGPSYATGNLLLRLMPMAVIVGHVLDESGDPVRSAQLHLYFEDHSGGMTQVRTAGVASSDDRGFFDVGPLQPGTYFLSAQAKPWYAVHPPATPGGNDSSQRVSPLLDVAYPTTFYGGATDADSASPIVVKGGERQEVDIRMSPVPALHLLVRIPDDKSLRMPIFQKREFDSMEYVQPSEFHPVGPGIYELSGIPAGRYDVSIHAADSGQAEQLGEVDLTHDGQDLSATPGQALGKLKLTIKMAGDKIPPKTFIVALRYAQRLRAGTMMPVDSGGVSFEAIKPGKYVVEVFSPGKQYAVTRSWTQGGELAGSEVTINPGSDMQLTVEVTAGEVSIEGLVQKNGEPASGIMVALVPKNPEANVELFRRDQSDLDGTFLLRGVILGTYTIVAVEDAWGFDWLKSGVLARYAQHSQTVVINESMRGTIRLPDAVEVQPR
jgi:5-hydroxyisourate hydrolase-like protein (transthyretin family)